MKWVPVRSSHLCIENEKAGGLPVRQLMIILCGKFKVDKFGIIFWLEILHLKFINPKLTFLTGTRHLWDTWTHTKHMYSNLLIKKRYTRDV